MSVLRSVAAPLALLLYAVLSSNCEPVDVALNKPIDARVTCGYSGPEQFLSHRYVYANSSIRLENTETCNDTTSYPPSAMVDGQQDTWWQSASSSNIIIVLGPSVNFQAEISIDLQQVCIHFDASARIASVTCIIDEWPMAQIHYWIVSVVAFLRFWRRLQKCHELLPYLLTAAPMHADV